MAASVFHLLFLHQTGSNNPLGVSSDCGKVTFHIYYTIKDAVGFLFLFVGISFVVFFFPNLFTDPENFLPANPLVTPIHIIPE